MRVFGLQQLDSIRLLTSPIHSQITPCKANPAAGLVYDAVLSPPCKCITSVYNIARSRENAGCYSTLKAVFYRSASNRTIHQTPIQALKEWQAKKPDLFVKRVYNQTGLDM